jgi:hypothetical protein
MEFLISDRKRCAVCGFSELRTDEAVDRGLVSLAECPRCESRWTSFRALPVAVAAAARAVPVRRVTHGAPGVAPAA